jgi:hypothetical protein
MGKKSKAIKKELGQVDAKYDTYAAQMQALGDLRTRASNLDRMNEFGAAVGFGLGGIGGAEILGGKRGNRDARKKTRKALAAKAKAEAQARAAAEQQYQYAKSEQAQKRGMDTLDKAYDAAMLQSARGAELARQSVRETGQAGGAQATQSLMNRGLYGTTVQDQAQRAVSSDTARNLGMINTALAEQTGQLGIYKAQGKQAGLAGLAQMYPSLAGMQTDTMFKFLQAFKKQPKTNVLEQALASFASGIGQGVGAAIF